MKISSLIRSLQEIYNSDGDLEVKILEDGACRSKPMDDLTTSTEDLSFELTHSGYHMITVPKYLLLISG